LGGPGAIGTAPPFVAAAATTLLIPFTPLVLEDVDLGDSELVGVLLETDKGVICATEFFLDDFFDLVPVLLVVVLPLPRLRFLITSVFNDKGLTTPCSFRKRPQALHSGWPSGFLLHKGVV